MESSDRIPRGLVNVDAILRYLDHDCYLSKAEAAKYLSLSPLPWRQGRIFRDLSCGPKAGDGEIKGAIRPCSAGRERMVQLDNGGIYTNAAGRNSRVRPEGG